ncbi:MAG TPA: transporter substrate-binding domain-containing protein, partial [Pseudonocardiaceae bacterium]|nr:transporter substrate-binding domain-containing protein [Pseudonocardiaceae bacterium]
KASPGTRAWAVLRKLRAGGWLRPRRIGCLLVLLLILILITLWVVGSAVNGIAAVFRNDPDPVRGGPFPTATPTSAPSSGPPVPDLINDSKLIVAVPEGFRPGGSAPGSGNYAGFDLALLDLVAHDLGAASVHTGKQAPVATRVGMLARGEADLGLFEITPQHRTDVDLVGPYLVSDLRLAVPADSAVTGPESLGDQKVCVTRGSPAAQALTDRLGDRLVTRARISDCTGLLGTRVGAIAGDEIALRALPETSTGELRMVGAALGTTEYGIGLHPGDPVLRERVVAVLRRAIADGTWRRLYEQRIGSPAPAPPTIR